RPVPQIGVSQQDCTGASSPNRSGGILPPPPPPPPPPPAGGRPACGIVGGFGSFSAGGVSMEQFSIALAQQVRRIVIDRTGLSGRFDFDLRWTPEQLPPGIPPDQPFRMNGVDIDPHGPSI